MSKRPSPALVLSALALFVSLSGLGIAATGGNFILGQSNTADKQTLLTGTVSQDAQLRVQNASTGANSYGLFGKMTSPSAGAGSAGVRGLNGSTDASAAGVVGVNTGGGPGLKSVVNSGAPPLSVNSQTKVADLNADLLDGLDSTGLLQNGDTAGGNLSGSYPDPSLANGTVGAATLTPLGSFFDNTPPIQAIPFVVRYLDFDSGTVSAGSSVDAVIYNANAPTTFQIIDAWLVLNGPGGCSGTCTWELRSATGGGGSTLFPAHDLSSGGQIGDIVRLSSLTAPSVIFQGSSVVLRFKNPGPGTGSGEFDLYLLALPST
jgi:hypothetical protein